MKVLFSWLQDFFDTPLPPIEEVADKLSLQVFDTIVEQNTLDIDVTPNRGSDCYCIFGIAYEVSAIFDIPLSRKYEEYSSSIKKSNNIKISIMNENCGRYTITSIENIDNTITTPQYIKDRIESMGGNSINLIVDILNYVMFEFGSPMHAFDKEKIQSNHIAVTTLKSNTDFVSLSKDTITLPKNTMVISNGETGEILAIAGIKGGLHSGVVLETKSILLEAAHFGRTKIRRTSKELNISTDASIRYEHNVHPNLIPFSINRVIEILTSISKNTKVIGYNDCYKNKPKRVEVTLSYKNLNKIAGRVIEEKIVLSILKKLNFDVILSDAQSVKVVQPVNRTDILIEEDIIEEILRLRGYDKIQVKTIEKIDCKDNNVHFTGRNRLIEIAAENGFSEILTRVFTSGGDIEVLDPHAKDRSFLRNNLKGEILKISKVNINNADLLELKSIKLIELGIIFKKEREECHLGIFIHNHKGYKVDKPNKILLDLFDKFNKFLSYDFFKGNLDEDNFIEIDITNLFSDKKLLPALKDMEYKMQLTENKFKSYSKYPHLVRDISLFAPINAKNKILEIIKKEVGELGIKVYCFDEFKKDESYSFSFRVIFQSDKRTLLDKEIFVILQKLEKTLKSNGFKIR